MKFRIQTRCDFVNDVEADTQDEALEWAKNQEIETLLYHTTNPLVSMLGVKQRIIGVPGTTIIIEENKTES